MHFRIRDLSAERCVWSVPPIDTVPVKLRCRVLAVRAFNANDVIVGEELIEGGKLASAIALLFADRHASYLHIYFATDNCYAARGQPRIWRSALLSKPPRCSGGSGHRRAGSGGRRSAARARGWWKKEDNASM
jgi:hypothetical protein